MALEIAMEIEHEILEGACDDFGLAVESTPHLGEPGCDLRSLIDVHIDHIESTPQNVET